MVEWLISEEWGSLDESNCGGFCVARAGEVVECNFEEGVGSWCAVRRNQPISVAWFFDLSTLVSLEAECE